MPDRNEPGPIRRAARTIQRPKLKSDHAASVCDGSNAPACRAVNASFRMSEAVWFLVLLAAGAAALYAVLNSPVRPSVPAQPVPQHFTFTSANCAFPVEQLRGSENYTQWITEMGIIGGGKWDAHLNPKTASAPASATPLQIQALQTVYFAVAPDLRADLVGCKTGHEALRVLMHVHAPLLAKV